MIKDNSVKAFLAIVCAGLWEQEIDLSTLRDIDYNKVLQLAQEQAVIGLVAAGFDQVVNFRVSQDIALTYAGEVLLLEQRNLAMNEFLEKLVKRFESEEIVAVVVKGQGIAQCYEKPLWRACGDIDFLLDDNNFTKAQKSLISIASRSEEVLKEEKHQEYEIGPWIVELHGNMPSHFSRKADKLLEKIQIEAFNEQCYRYWKNGDTVIKLLGIDADVLFVFTHILKHFFRGGIGLRQICDWCRLLWTYREEINKPLLEQRLKQMGLISEWKSFAALAVYELGYPAKEMLLYSDYRIWKRKSSKILEFVLKTGNFGHNRDTDYYKQYPYLVTKVISFYWRMADNLRYFFIFPGDSFRVFGWLIRHGVKNL